jgi:FlaA1/EpsC-like NDP-sugar epimerase
MESYIMEAPQLYLRNIDSRLSLLSISKTYAIFSTFNNVHSNSITHQNMALSPVPYDFSNSLRELSQGKSIVITGGGTGIGAGIAHAFAAAGSTQIAVLGRRQTKLSETAQAIRTAVPGTKILTLSTDVTDIASVNTAFEEILKAFGRIDVLVNNAGAISTFTPAATSDIADW